MSQEIETLHKPFIRFLRTEKLPYIRARSDMRSTIAAGAHDFTVFFGGKALCCEFKDKGELSKDQKAWIEGMTAAQCKVYVLRDLASAIELVRAWRDTLAKQTPAGEALTHSKPRLSIRNVPGSGDYVFAGESLLRRATVGDLDLPRTRSATGDAQPKPKTL